MRSMVDLGVQLGDIPRRGRTPQGKNYVELASTWGPVLRLHDLPEAEQLTYLRELSRQCDLLVQDIERAAADVGEPE